jgi:non-homologous end joining protein Ku
MAARNVASGVALQFGLISAAVSMTSALDKVASSGNVMVCDNGHPAQQIRSPKWCDACDGEVPFQQLKKARPVEGGLAVLEASDLAEVNADAQAFKKSVQVSAHPAEQVEVRTSVGEKMYFLTPDKGHEAGYAAVLGLVSNHPELAFMTQWTPRTAAAQFQVRAYDGVLVLQERTRAGTVRSAPDVTLGDNEALVAMAEQFLAMPGLVTDYDPETYADKSQERLAAILATKEVVPTADATTVTPVVVDDLMAKLAAHLSQAAAKEDKPAPKKARAKKEKATA